MQIPTIEGLIRRRLLVNFRLDPEILARRLPAPFRPKLQKGCAIAGICPIRLERHVEDSTAFPEGSVQFDRALWMRDIRHRRLAAPSLEGDVDNQGEDR